MRKIIILCFLLIAAGCYGQNYYTVNWAKAPENPIPVKFTTNHFGLNGKVKMMVTRNSFVNEITAFDEKGLCKGIKEITQYDTTESVYFYALPDKFVIQSKKNNNKYGNRLDAYSLKFSNTVVESTPADSKGQPAESLKMLYNYNNKGLYEELKTDGKYNNALQYQYYYNEAKQIIKIREHQAFEMLGTATTKELNTTTYEYNQKGDSLIITITETQNTPVIKIISTKDKVYNQDGLLIYEKNFSNGNTSILSSTYVMDAQNNWTTRTQTNLTEGSENKGKSTVTNRMIQYY